MRHALSRFVKDVRDHGARAYHKARHVARGLDNVIATSARVYGGVIQPILRSQGVDTRELDRHLLTSHAAYNQLKDHVEKGHRVVEGVAANLRGGDFKYSA